MQNTEYDTFYDDIHLVIHKSNDPQYNTKGDIINLYEQLLSVRVMDSAIPLHWSNAVREYLSVRNIGEWASAYLEEGGMRIIPCNERALAYFDHFVEIDKFV